MEDHFSQQMSELRETVYRLSRGIDAEADNVASQPLDLAEGTTARFTCRPRTVVGNELRPDSLSRSEDIISRGVISRLEWEELYDL